MDMFEIIHNNCQKQKVIRELQQKKKAYYEEQQYGKKMCKILFFTVLGGLLFEILLLTLGW